MMPIKINITFSNKKQYRVNKINVTVEGSNKIHLRKVSKAISINISKGKLRLIHKLTE